MNLEEKMKTIEATAEKFGCFILVKAVVDIISDGKVTYLIEGGNQGLTKGGTGDLLAGLVLSFASKNDQLTAMILSSYFLKKTAEELFKKKGYWYNINDLIETVPQVIKRSIFIKK